MSHWNLKMSDARAPGCEMIWVFGHTGRTIQIHVQSDGSQRNAGAEFDEQFIGDAVLPPLIT
jgi:hypothetical protein